MLSLGGSVGAHVARQIQQRAYRETVPVQRHAPLRLREVVGCAEADRQRQAFTARRTGFHLYRLRCQVQSSRKFKGPALSVRRHAVPAVYVFHQHAARDADIVERTGEMHAR